ncbi:MAG: hypothetical protein ACREA2_11955 [Blastocatellia bacterium]
MRQRFLALLFSAGIYIACAPPLQAQTTNSNNPDLVLAQAAANQLTYLPAADALRKARLLFIRSRSSWFNPEKLERELLKRKEFGELGLELTRSADHTELVLEITRKTFTTRFTCSIIEPTTQRVLAAVIASSLGGEIEPHLAEAIIKQFKAARSKPATEEMKPE